MSTLPRIIQGLILFSTVLGVVFLWQAYPLLPADAFGFVAVGWVLFVADSFLTFLRPMASYYLGVALGVLALGATLSQPAHFALVGSGALLASATIVLGSAAEALLVVIGAYYLMSTRKKAPLRLSGAEPEA